MTEELNGSARPHRDSATLVLRVLAFDSPTTVLSNCPGGLFPESPSAWHTATSPRAFHEGVWEGGWEKLF